MKKKSSKEAEHTDKRKPSGASQSGVGAHGSRATPKTGDSGPKWPGGGKKGENE
jgi:hypothetical protein